MREELAWFHKISIYGSRQEIDHAKLWLVGLALTEVESTDRLVIQDCIDTHKLKASILYNGNGVYPYNKIMEEYKKLLKLWVRSLSDYLYKFLSLQWTIAHYNKQGWIETYPRLDDVKEILLTATVPSWKTDVQRILDWLLSLSNLSPCPEVNRPLTRW